jgi:hypothetical protein
MKKITFVYIFLTLSYFLFVFSYVDASGVLIIPSKSTVGIAEQFSVDILLDPENKPINAIEGTVAFDQTRVSLIRAETARSLVNLWISEPRQDHPGSVVFAGIIPNGFNGVIDPFNPHHVLPGLVVRLIFEGQKSGDANIGVSSFITAANDGKGTTEKSELKNASITVENVARPKLYVNSHRSSPVLEAHIIQDQNLFNSKYSLIYDAVDRGTGIKDVRVREGNRDWQSIIGPYVLLDQSRHVPITIQAINFEGQSVVLTINPLPKNFFTMYTILILIVIILILVGVYKKIYEHKK